MNFKCIIISLICSLSVSIDGSAQEYTRFTNKRFAVKQKQNGYVQTHGDERIKGLMTLFKKINNENEEIDGYRIQIYSGNREKALEYADQFKKKFRGIHVYTNYEQPNFKTKVGAYRNELYARKALQEIKKKFPGAFIFREKINYKEF